MTTFQVWHKDVPAFFGATDDDLAAFPVGYTHVANVETADVREVFQLTNHIDAPWFQNPEVEPIGTTDRLRSTSVGDVIVGGGKRVAVENIGLREF
jgi:hypothetical protein